MISGVGDIHSSIKHHQDNQTIAQKAGEISKLKSLEEEKMKLQMQLDEARSALHSYATKLDTKADMMEGSLKLKDMNEDHFAEFHHHHEELLASQLVASVGKSFISSDEQNFNTTTSSAFAKDTSKN